MIQKNVFHKGLIADLDVSKRSADTWDFPTLNIRIFNKDGQGLIRESPLAAIRFTPLITDQ